MLMQLMLKVTFLDSFIPLCSTGHLTNDVDVIQKGASMTFDRVYRNNLQPTHQSMLNLA
jgi:predicted outer membrane protein